MSKLLHSLGAEKKKRAQKGSEVQITDEVAVIRRSARQQQVNEEQEEAPVTQLKSSKKSKKRGLESSQSEENIEQLVIQPNAKKVRLSSNLRPVNKSSAFPSKSGTSSTINTKLSSVVYLGHLPKGFDEDEIRKFFNQFGKIKRMKLFRAKKSLASKGYAFLEFETEEIAAVVADAMNGYFLMERQLVAERVAKDKLHEGMFLQTDQSRQIKKLAKQQGKQLETIEDTNVDVDLVITEENFDQVYEKHEQYTQKKQQQLAKKGIDYQIPIVSKTGELILKVKDLSEEVHVDNEKTVQQIEEPTVPVPTGKKSRKQNNQKESSPNAEEAKVPDQQESTKSQVEENNQLQETPIENSKFTTGKRKTNRASKK